MPQRVPRINAAFFSHGCQNLKGIKGAAHASGRCRSLAKYCLRVTTHSFSCTQPVINVQKLLLRLVFLVLSLVLNHCFSNSLNIYFSMMFSQRQLVNIGLWRVEDRGRREKAFTFSSWKSRCVLKKYLDCNPITISWE